MKHKILIDAQQRMDKSISLLTEQFASVRGFGNGFIDTIKVNCYGSTSPLSHVSQILGGQGNSVIVRPHDPNILKDILDAIQGANLGLGTSTEKGAVRVSIPTMSGEQKEKQADHLERLAESFRVAVRHVRGDAKKKIDKGKELSEDERDGLVEDLQELTDQYIGKIDDLTAKKVKMLME